MSSSPGAWSYSRAGVDRGSVQESLAALLAQLHFRPRPDHGRPLGTVGHYAGLVRVGRETLAVTTDTVGTKVRLAEQLGEWEGVGQDIVAVNVNDLAAVGARPCGLVDVISCAQPNPAVFASIGRGLDAGLREAGCAILGGETAIVPSIVSGYDLGGTAIGFFPRGRSPVTGRGIRPGDVLFGVPARGFHANGFTLIRRLAEAQNVDYTTTRPGASTSVGSELLRPTRIYVAVSEAMASRPETHGLAHISGGGVRNLVRLNDRVRFVLDGWPTPTGLFEWVHTLGPVELSEMYQTFNMGIGFVVVTSSRRESETRRRLARAGAPDAYVVGHVERGRGVRLPHLGLSYDGYA